MRPGELERVQPRSRAEWRRWLSRNHLTAPGCWLVTHRKATGKARLAYEEAIEELLCFGWIDSTARKLDAERTMLRCTPRKPRSAWSASNKARVARLEAAGRMAARGLEVLAQAKRSGGWTALDAVERLEVPAELAARLDTLPPARAHWDTFPPSARRALLWWVASAKRPETRARRIEEIAFLAQRNVRANEGAAPARKPRRPAGR